MSYKKQLSIIYFTTSEVMETFTCSLSFWISFCNPRISTAFFSLNSENPECPWFSWIWSRLTWSRSWTSSLSLEALSSSSCLLKREIQSHYKNVSRLIYHFIQIQAKCLRPPKQVQWYIVFYLLVFQGLFDFWCL